MDIDITIDISQQLKELLEKYRFSEGVLSKYLSLPVPGIRAFAQGDLSILPESHEARFRIFNKIAFIYAIPGDGPDKKLRAFLQVLLSFHHVSKETIARMSGVEKSEIEKFLSASERDIPVDEKYKLAVAAMGLRFFLKELEP